MKYTLPRSNTTPSRCYKFAFTIFSCLLLHTIAAPAQSWQTLADSGQALRQQKKFGSSLELYQMALASLPPDSGNSRIRQEILLSTGDAFLSTGKFDSAVLHYQEAGKIITNINGSGNEDYAAVTNLIGNAYYRFGKYDSCQKYFIETLNIRKKNQGPKYASSCNNLANLYSDTGKYDKAEPLYQEALLLREKDPGKESAEYAQSCNNLGDVYRRMGLYSKAELLMLTAKDIRSRVLGKQHIAYAISCTNLANLYREMGQYKKAEENYLEAKLVREAAFTKMSSEYAQSCNILADLYEATGQYDKAETLYLEALDTREKILGNQHRDYAQSCNNLGALYLAMGDHAKAKPLLLQAGAIWQKTLAGDDPAIALNNSSLAALYTATSDFSQAEKLFTSSLFFWKKKAGTQQQNYLQNAAGLARLYWQTGKLESANQLYLLVLETQSKNIREIFQFTTENEKQQYLQSVSGLTSEYLSFLYSNNIPAKGAIAYHISLLNRNLTLYANIQLRKDVAGDSSLNKLFAAWVAERKTLARLIVNNKNDSGERERIQGKADSLEKILTRRSNVFQQHKKNIDWEDIRINLKPADAAVEFISFSYFDGKKYSDSIFYVAAVLGSHMQSPAFVPLFEKKQWDTIVHSRNKNSSGDVAVRGVKLANVDNNQWQSFYRLAWLPLEKYFGGAKKIFYAPAGELFKLPFAALPAANALLLCDKFQLEQLNTTASLTDDVMAGVAHTDNIVLYGGIDYDVTTDSTEQSEKDGSQNNFEYLPGTAVEVRAIKKMADASGIHAIVLSDTIASELSFKTQSGVHSPAVLHIATHGFFFPATDAPNDKPVNNSLDQLRTAGNPLFRSGLAFSGANESLLHVDRTRDDGIVTAYDISNMDLSNTRLVVLSACETALGDVNGSEGVYGLQRCFKIAGVQNLIMSLWAVPDKETAAFMQLFYQSLFKKFTVANAFYDAQTKMRNNYRDQPAKWAAWVLVR